MRTVPLLTAVLLAVLLAATFHHTVAVPAVDHLLDDLKADKDSDVESTEEEENSDRDSLAKVLSDADHGVDAEAAVPSETENNELLKWRGIKKKISAWIAKYSRRFNARRGHIKNLASFLSTYRRQIGPKRRSHVKKIAAM